MTNTTLAATDSDDYSDIARGLNSVPINNLLLIVGSIVLLSAVVCTFWQFSKNKGSEMSVEESPKDCENSRNEKPMSTRKSVRFADEEPCQAHVTPQLVPTKVSLAVGSDAEDERVPQWNRSSTTFSNLFKSFSRSLSLYSIKSAESEDLEDVDQRSHSRPLPSGPSPLSDERSRHLSSPLSDVGLSNVLSDDDSMNDFTDVLSKRSSTIRSPVSVCSPRHLQIEAAETRNRGKSEPVQADENGFYVGEEVQYRGRSRWKRGVVTSINPLKVQGDGNYRARAYEQVRKLQELPSKIGEEVDDMDVREMTFDDFKRLMQSARRNTRAGREILADTAKCQSQLVETLARNQK